MTSFILWVQKFHLTLDLLTRVEAVLFALIVGVLRLVHPLLQLPHLELEEALCLLLRGHLAHLFLRWRPTPFTDPDGTGPGVRVHQVA